jgi:Effector-associated domain 2
VTGVARTRAVLVGVEEYAAGPDWRLDGPALDACRYARWLLDRGVSADRIHLLVAPLEHNRAAVDALGLPVHGADSATVDRVLQDTVRGGATDEFLFVHWGGHGVVDVDDTRRLFYADADAANRRNLHVDGYLRALRTDYFPQEHQLILVDACQNFAARWRGPRTLPVALPPFGRQRAGREQYALFAAAPGERAQNLGSRRTGLFSEVVLEELAAGAWPPDAAALTDAVARRFADLRATGHSRQTPSYLWYHAPHGERRIEVPAPAAPPRRLDLAAMRVISTALLDIDELLDPSVRRLMLLYLPRDVAVTVHTTDDARQQVLSWIRTCDRFPGGRDAFLEALEMTVPAAEYARAAKVITTHWP